MSRNAREGRYMGYSGRHIRSHWHAECYAPLAIMAFSVVKTRADQCW